jgi:lipopolysaccharide transport system permease protein
MRSWLGSRSPWIVFRSFWRHRRLIWQLAQRETLARYRGSLLGTVWAVFNPLLMLAVYTFVFGFVFQARWQGEPTGIADFALILFCGMIVFALFSECVNRAPGLIIGNTNYVKKVLFPLESLPWVTLASTLFHTAASVAVLLVATLITRGGVPWTVVFLPVVLLPLTLLTLGVCWFLASLGVFVRDVGQVVGVATTILLFLSPVFYSPAALPEHLRGYLLLNPLTLVVEQARAVTLRGQLPDWPALLAYAAVSLAVAWGGLLWFEQTRDGFADVL